MGTAVLNTTLTPIPKDKEHLPNLHVYAHCSRAASHATRTNGSDGAAREGGVGNGSITLAFVNISPSATFSLNLLNLSLGLNSMANKGRRYDYIFSTPHGVLSKVVALNGKPLAMVHDSLPQISPVEAGAFSLLHLAPLGYGFAVLPDADVPACGGSGGGSGRGRAG
jgi:hypothetical protein